MVGQSHINADCLFVSFDESLNNLTPASNLDICIWFWKRENNWFEDRYWGSKVSRHTTHRHLLGSIQLFTVSALCFYCGTTFSCKFWKGEDQEKKWVLGVPTTDICLEGTFYVSCQKSLSEVWFWGKIFKCQSLPVLSIQPINV